MTRSIRRLRRWATLAAALSLWAAPGEAGAWDPSTTHAGMTTRALTDSAVHLRWMEASGLSRGLFSSLRIDPRRLSPDLRRRIELSQRRAHADSGAQGLGGPGACPGVTAPASTRTRCVDGDQWESTALGWVALGIVAEITPRERVLHHFVAPQDPTASTWTGKKVSKSALRAAQRRGGGAALKSITGTAFSGTATSAVGWLSDPEDPWAPPAMFEHLRKASLLTDAASREHHLALALIGLGALLHVVQDTSVPAHARADLGAFLAPLSRTPGDRGLPLSEYARVLHGRAGLPTRLPLSPREAATPRRGVLLAETLLGHLTGVTDGPFEGVAVTAGSRFLSEATLPAPQNLAPSLSPQAAAALLLADSGLSADEVAGATLSAWPADAGYVLSSLGRPLAAFVRDAQSGVQLHLDRRVYRDQIGQLVPLAIDASRSIVDLVFPAWPTTQYHPGGNVLEIDATNLPGRDVELSILIEDAAGNRRHHRTIALQRGARRRIVGAVPVLDDDEQVVMVVRTTIGAHRLTTESLLSGSSAADDDAAPPTADALAPNVRPTAPSAGAGKDAAPPTDGTVQPPKSAPPASPPPTDAGGTPSDPPADGAENPPSTDPALTDPPSTDPPSTPVPPDAAGGTAAPGGPGAPPSEAPKRTGSAGVVPTRDDAR